MNRRLSEIITDEQDLYCQDANLFDYDTQMKRVMMEQDPNFYLNELEIKQEEPLVDENENFQEFLTTAECLAYTLQMPVQVVHQISISNPLGLRQLMDKATRVIRREKAKLRTALRMKDAPVETKEIVSVPILPPVLEKKRSSPQTIKQRKERKIMEKDLPKLEEMEHSASDAATESNKQQKKMVQMIRNRISAQNSRDRKKAYVSQLEMTSNIYDRQNQQLQQKIKDLQAQTGMIQKQNYSLRKQLEDMKVKILGQKSKESDQSTAKQSFGKIGLTLLTLVSVYLMMGRVSESDTKLGVQEFEIKRALSTQPPLHISDLETDLGCAPSKKVCEELPYEIESPSKHQFSLELESVKSQLELMMKEKGILKGSFESMILEKERSLSKKTTTYRKKRRGDEESL